MNFRNLSVVALLVFSLPAFAETVPGEYIIKFKNQNKAKALSGQVEYLGGGMVLAKTGADGELPAIPKAQVEYIQPNYVYHYTLYRGPKASFESFTTGSYYPTNDPKYPKQWGMHAIGAHNVWDRGFRGNSDIVVAVIDTGVDYRHEDLAANIWHNTREIPGNGIDDDGNGYIDDMIGWDFHDDDNDPMDDTSPALLGGNPGHGTHCAGNVGAVGNNGIGISGVAQRVTIMPLRFLGKDGSGNTAAAVRAIYYGINNGAHILSNSWGSNGHDEDDQALKDAIAESEKKDILFIAAAGNHAVNNDSSSKAGYPASYNFHNIISVAASDNKSKLASFSCFGKETVDLAAPGVAIYSTVPGNRYRKSVIPFLADWSGTSMATPMVAGAAALIKGYNPSLTYREIKQILMDSVEKAPGFDSYTKSGGILNIDKAMQKVTQ